MEINGMHLVFDIFHVDNEQRQLFAGASLERWKYFFFHYEKQLHLHSKHTPFVNRKWHLNWGTRAYENRFKKVTFATRTPFIHA